MKKILPIFILIILIAINAFPQSNMPEARNNIYISFGFVPFGPLSVGLNYERMISPNACIKVGVNYSYMFSSKPDFSGDAYFSIPITINYLTSNKNKFEIGVGGGPNFKIKGMKGDHFPLRPAFSIGYRYQQDNKSAIYRLGIEMPAALAFNLYGIGYTF